MVIDPETVEVMISLLNQKLEHISVLDVRSVESQTPDVTTLGHLLVVEYPIPPELLGWIVPIRFEEETKWPAVVIAKCSGDKTVDLVMKARILLVLAVRAFVGTIVIAVLLKVPRRIFRVARFS